MTLTGNCGTLGPSNVFLNPSQRTLGRETAQQTNKDYPVDSFFDVWIDLDVNGIPSSVRPYENRPAAHEITVLPNWFSLGKYTDNAWLQMYDHNNTLIGQMKLSQLNIDYSDFCSN